MAVVAAIAAALALTCSLIAVNLVGSVAMTSLLSVALLVPRIVLVAIHVRPPAVAKLRVTLPPATLRLVRFALFGAVLVMVSAKRLPPGAAGAVVVAASLTAYALAIWWPHPAALRLSVALSVLVLARPNASPTAHVGVLVLMGVGVAVALVAASWLANADHAVLGGKPAKPLQGRRLGAEAAVVALALLLGAVLAARLDARQPRPPQPQAGAQPQRRPPEPLDYRDLLDPNQAGPDGQGGDPDEVILKVNSDRAGVLRAVTFDQWDGHRWRRSEALEGPGGIRHRFVPVFNDSIESFPGNVSEQRIRVEAPYAGVAVGTPRVYVYELPGGGEVALDGTVRLRPALGKGAEYTAQTAWEHATPDQLRAAPTGESTGADRRFNQERQPNPNVTADPVVSERARSLVEGLTASARTDYDKVDALSRYLSTHVTVDGKAPALAAADDPIDSVLFGAAPAPAVRLATTLAVLTRAAGIPSRLATGFLAGQRPFFGGDFVVRAGDAHAWVEVPFIGVGWVRFDPSGRIAAAEQQDSLWSRLKRAWDRFWPLFVLVIVAVVALVVRRLVLRRRRWQALPWATRFFARLVRVGAKRGRARAPAETPAEYTTALAGGVLADERLVEVGRVVTAAAWSGREPAPDTRRWAEQVLDEAAQATRPSRVPGRRRRPRTPVGRS